MGHWTARTILGVMLILAVWSFGFYGVDFVLRGMWNHHNPAPDWQPISIVILYCVAGPGTVAVWIRWARKKAGEEHEDGTRERIGALRVAVRPDQAVGPFRRKRGARCLRQ